MTGRARTIHLAVVALLATMAVGSMTINEVGTTAERARGRVTA